MTFVQRKDSACSCLGCRGLCGTLVQQVGQCAQSVGRLLCNGRRGPIAPALAAVLALAEAHLDQGGGHQGAAAACLRCDGADRPVQRFDLPTMGHVHDERPGSVQNELLQAVRDSPHGGGPQILLAPEDALPGEGSRRFTRLPG